MRIPICVLLVSIGLSARAEPPRVVADIAPVHGLVSRVMQGVAEADLLVPPGASPHGYALRPSEARALAGADIVFWVGPMLAPWLGGPIETLAGGAEHVDLPELAGVTVLNFREDDRFEAHGHAHGAEQERDHGHDDAKALDDGHAHASEHGEEHDEAESHAHAHDEKHGDDHGDDHGDAHDGHEHGEIDSHLWLDPANAVVWIDTIARRLAEHDPANAQRYLDNAAAAQAEIVQLSSDLRAQLGPLAGRPFVVFHDSYQYFERAFGVTATAAITFGDAGTANAARLARIREIVAETDARCALAEPRVNAGLVEAVSRESALRIVTLDAVGIEIAPGAGYYPALLQQIADGLADCLGDG